jgi:hypothetical protein
MAGIDRGTAPAANDELIADVVHEARQRSWAHAKAAAQCRRRQRPKGTKLCQQALSPVMTCWPRHSETIMDSKTLFEYKLVCL